MAYCVDIMDCREGSKPAVKWTPCQETCSNKHMSNRQDPVKGIPDTYSDPNTWTHNNRQDPDFVEYTNCMATCTHVPISPWTQNAANLTSASWEPYCCAGVNDCESFAGTDTCPNGQQPMPYGVCVSSCMKAGP